LTEALQRLRKVLALERSRKFADTAVIGGLDAYLQRVVSGPLIPADHRFRRVLSSLPSGGYRALHPVQRKRVVEELELALAEGMPIAAVFKASAPHLIPAPATPAPAKLDTPSGPGL